MDITKYMTGIQHVGIPTNDLDKTIAFYQRLGFVVAHQTVNEKANEKVAFLQFGNLTIETYENHAATLCSGPSIMWLLTSRKLISCMRKSKRAVFIYSMIQYSIFRFGKKVLSSLLF